MESHRPREVKNLTNGVAERPVWRLNKTENLLKTRKGHSCALASIIAVRYILGIRCAGRAHTKLAESKATACNPGGAERYINPIARHLKAVPRRAEADWQSFVNHRR
jgi:hypothetical protein